MSSNSKSVDPLDELVSRLRLSRFAAGIRCPRCGGRRHARWGTFRCRQRYRCTSCRRTFSDLTGSPAVYTKKILLWPEFAALLGSGVSLRQAARQLGVHPSTTFRWRHALLRALIERDDEKLAGWIEVAGQRFAQSDKGSRRLQRPARRRGFRPSVGGDVRTVHVLVASDRVGHYVSVYSVAPRGRRPGPEGYDRLLSGRVEAAPVVVVAGGRFSAAARVARTMGGTIRDAGPTTRRKRRSLILVGTARGCIARLRDWLRRFRGVATRYLPNYLIWHRIVDRATRRAIGEEALRWPGSAFQP
jgi:transposase-like protein